MILIPHSSFMKPVNPALWHKPTYMHCYEFKANEATKDKKTVSDKHNEETCEYFKIQSSINLRNINIRLK